MRSRNHERAGVFPPGSRLAPISLLQPLDVLTRGAEILRRFSSLPAFARGSPRAQGGELPPVRGPASSLVRASTLRTLAVVTTSVEVVARVEPVVGLNRRGGPDEDQDDIDELHRGGRGRRQKSTPA